MFSALEPLRKRSLICTTALATVPLPIALMITSRILSFSITFWVFPRTSSQSLSISYADFEPKVPTDYQKKTCDLFPQLGAKGISVFIASSDNGLGSNCPNGKYVPMYSSDCPWITSMGGPDGTSTERAWSGSGGGFSNVFLQPEWQKLP